MFNLLQHKLKKKIRSEYNLHFLIVILLSILTMQVLFLILLSPSWFLSLSKEKDVIAQVENLNTPQLDQEIILANSTIRSINMKLNKINLDLEYPEVVPFFDAIISKKTNSIYIKELVYISSKSGAGTITLSGIGATRDDLMSFVKRLEGTELFEKVDLPISNLTKEKNIDFSMNLIINVL